MRSAPTMYEIRKADTISLVVVAFLAICDAKPPVILIPGLAGSVFRMKLQNAPAPHIWCEHTRDWFTTWVNVAQLIPEQKDCLLARVMPYFNESSKTYHDAPGVTLDTNVDFGGVGGIAYLDPSIHIRAFEYYQPMISFLRSLGYVSGIDLHGAPYDWRAAPDGHLAPGGYYSRLQTLIEATVARNSHRATLVSHSLGGTTTLAFLRTRPAAWLEKYVAGFVPISSPWGGGTLMVLADVSGDNFGLPVPEDYLRPVQCAAASGVFVLPTAAAFGNTTIVSAGGRKYTAADMYAFLGDLGLEQAQAILRNLNRLKLNTADLGPPPDSVRVLAISSRGVQTAAEYGFKRAFAPGFEGHADSIVYGDGDGTVNRRSLAWPANGGWPPANGASRTFLELDGVKHFSTIDDARTFSALKAFLAEVAR